MTFAFPHFKKISLSHKNTIEKLIDKYPPFSDFTFTSLWTYNTGGNAEFSILNDNFVVKFQDYITNKTFFSFMGSCKPIHTALTLLDFSIKQGIDPILKLIPQTVIHVDPGIHEHVRIVEDPDNHDYIISAKDLATLPKYKYEKKGYLIRRFGRKYPHHTVNRLDLASKKVQSEMRALFYRWEKVSKHPRSDTQNELNAFNRMLSSSRQLGVSGTGIYQDGGLIAFTTYEVVHQDYGMALFEKADKMYTDIYTAITYTGALHLYELGVKHINFEQDLGIEGLRAAKSLWKPTHFLKKYIITPVK